MDSGRLGQRWLLACAAAALLANYFGGFSLVVTGVFVAICLIGAALIGSGEDPVGMGFPADDWAVDAVTAGGFTAPVDVVAAPDEVAAEYAEPYPGEDAEPYPGEDESDESAVLDVTAETEPSPA